jgi:hypothetical protein
MLYKEGYSIIERSKRCSENQSTLSKMADNFDKSEIARADRETEKTSLENGALEKLHSSYQFSQDAEKRLVRKIDLTFVHSSNQIFHALTHFSQRPTDHACRVCYGLLG